MDGRLVCGCLLFCEQHGREEIGIDPITGQTYCNECAADGFSGELCTPSSDSCDRTSDRANVWERQFMCQDHAEKHQAFCAVCGDHDGQ